MEQAQSAAVGFLLGLVAGFLLARREWKKVVSDLRAGQEAWTFLETFGADGRPCRFCGGQYAHAAGSVEEHERHCYLNPARKSDQER